MEERNNQLSTDMQREGRAADGCSIALCCTLHSLSHEAYAVIRKIKPERVKPKQL